MMPRLSEGLILHVRQHEIVWKYIINIQRNRGSKTLAIKVEQKCGGITLRMKAGRKCGKAELQIFGNQGTVEMRKRNFTYFKDQAEMSCAES